MMRVYHLHGMVVAVDARGRRRFFDVAVDGAVREWSGGEWRRARKGLTESGPVLWSTRAALPGLVMRESRGTADGRGAR